MKENLIMVNKILLYSTLLLIISCHISEIKKESNHDIRIKEYPIIVNKDCSEDVQFKIQVSNVLSKKLEILTEHESDSIRIIKNNHRQVSNIDIFLNAKYLKSNLLSFKNSETGRIIKSIPIKYHNNNDTIKYNIFKWDELPPIHLPASKAWHLDPKYQFEEGKEYIVSSIQKLEDTIVNDSIIRTLQAKNIKYRNKETNTEILVPDYQYVKSIPILEGYQLKSISKDLSEIKTEHFTSSYVITVDNSNAIPSCLIQAEEVGERRIEILNDCYPIFVESHVHILPLHMQFQTYNELEILKMK